ncbi:hypothetical protein C0J52_06279 [Blattella germanica]|nr:hypothetical protein C0J52_06279 [Blattella germanica]
MCDNQTNRSRGISDNTTFTAACSVLQTMSVSSSRRYRNARDSNTIESRWNVLCNAGTKIGSGYKGH